MCPQFLVAASHSVRKGGKRWQGELAKGIPFSHYPLSLPRPTCAALCWFAHIWFMADFVYAQFENRLHFLRLLLPCLVSPLMLFQLFGVRLFVLTSVTKASFASFCTLFCLFCLCFLLFVLFFVPFFCHFLRLFDINITLLVRRCYFSSFCVWQRMCVCLCVCVHSSNSIHLLQICRVAFCLFKCLLKLSVCCCFCCCFFYSSCICL